MNDIEIQKLEQHVKAGHRVILLREDQTYSLVTGVGPSDFIPGKVAYLDSSDGQMFTPRKINFASLRNHEAAAFVIVQAMTEHVRVSPDSHREQMLSLATIKYALEHGYQEHEFSKGNSSHFAFLRNDSPDIEVSWFDGESQATITIQRTRTSSDQEALDILRDIVPGNTTLRKLDDEVVSVELPEPTADLICNRCRDRKTLPAKMEGWTCNRPMPGGNCTGILSGRTVSQTTGE